MDKGMKAEIGKIITEVYIKGNHAGYDKRNWGKLSIKCGEVKSHATSSLTTLIIKWLESKRVKTIDDYGEIAYFGKGRNQLIAELKGELK